MDKSAEKLIATRPTAVNLAWAVKRQLKEIRSKKTTDEKIAIALKTANEIADEDADFCRRLGEHGLEIIKEIAETISKDDDEILINAAKTAMNAKGISTLKDFFAGLALEAVKQISDDDGNTFNKVSNVKIVKAPGKSLKDSKLINGVYIQKEKLNVMMPDVIKDAKIAVIRRKLDVKKTEFDAQVRITSPTEIQRFLDQEEKILLDYMKIFKDQGVNMIVNSSDISDKFGAFLARDGIAAIKNVGESDYKSILKAVDAKLVDDLSSLTESDLGFATKVEFEKIGDDDYTLFSGCKNPKSVSILLKGGLDKILSTAEVSLHDVLSVIAKIMDTKTVVAGGGAIYIELAKQIRLYANQIGGKEQLAVLAFALTLEEIPRTLIKNAGLEEIEKLTELRAAHKTDNDKWIGIDTITNTIEDNFIKGIVEPAALLIHIIKSGTELANLILRIDRIISAKGS